MSRPNRQTMKVPEGVDVVSPNYTHPQLVMNTDMHAVPINLVIGFSLVLTKDSRLFSGKTPTQPRHLGQDEKTLFARPYTEWAPAPFNNRSIRADSAMNRALAAVAGMHDLSALLNSTSTQCDRDLHHMKTRLLHGLPPMSPARWRTKGLHEPGSVKRACQHLCAVVDAFEYLNLPHNQSRVRAACNMTWKECHDFSEALSAYRHQKGRGPVSVTAAWEEYMVDYFETVAARAHAWVTGRVDELTEMLLLRLQSTTAAADDRMSDAQKAILDSIRDLGVIAKQADTRIMLPLSGYALETLTFAKPWLRENWNGYSGAEPMTQYPSNMRTRDLVYGLRREFLGDEAMAQMPQMAIDDARDGTSLASSVPRSLERLCRLLSREHARARRELRGPPPETGDEPWIGGLKMTMEMAVRPPVRVWGFVGYRISYAHSDEEWEEFLKRFTDEVTAWGEGVDGAADVKPTCQLTWIDGREHGIPEGDVEAARRQYEAYSKSPACEDLLTARHIFLAADKASIDSYLEPVLQDAAEPVIPRGDLGGFVLAVEPAGAEGTGDGRRGRGAGAPGDEFDGTLRVLGAILFDDFWALIYRGAFHTKDLARMAEIHPRHVYTGPSVPVERRGWRDAGCWSLTAFKSFEKWRAL